jgi:pre-mRNA-splicing factor SYF2
MSEAGTSGAQGGSVKERMEERMKKLRDLHLKRNEARQLNHAEVIEEDRFVQFKSLFG